MGDLFWPPEWCVCPVGCARGEFSVNFAVAFRFDRQTVQCRMNELRFAPIILFFGALLPSIRCAAFPIEPVSLLGLLRESELVVLARVEPPPLRPQADPNKSIVGFSLRGESPARLRPISIFIGTAPKGLIEVHFNPNMVCPSPPRFEHGEEVLAFLRRARDGNGYTTVALDYGAKHLSEAKTRAYTERIAEWSELTRVYQAAIPTNAVVEWLVKCVENPATMHEGATDLVNRRPFFGTNLIRSAYAPHLSAQQRLRISNVVFRAEYTTSGVLTLYDLFKDNRRDLVVRHALGCLRRASKPIPPVDTPYKDSDALPEPWTTFDAMWLVADLVNSPAAQAFVNRFNRTEFFSWQNRVTQLKEFLPLVESVAVRKGYLKASEASMGK